MKPIIFRIRVNEEWIPGWWFYVERNIYRFDTWEEAKQACWDWCANPHRFLEKHSGALRYSGAIRTK